MTNLPATIDASPITDMVKDEVAQLRRELEETREVLAKNLAETQSQIRVLRTDPERLNICEGQHDGFDIYPALQAALNQRGTDYRVPYIRPGRWVCKGNVEISRLAGARLQFGGHGGDVSDKRLRGRGTVVTFAGDPDKPFITDAGSHLIMEGGCNFKGLGKGNGIGYVQTKLREGIGTGKSIWQGGHWSWEGFDVCLQTGLKESDQNCENNTWGSHSFEQATYGYHMLAMQGMGQVFDNMGCGPTLDYLVAVTGGGYFQARKVGCHAGLIKFLAGSAGKANSYYEFGLLKIDGSNPPRPRIDNTDGCRAHIVINGGVNSNDKDRSVMAKLRGGCSLTVRDFRGFGLVECESKKIGDGTGRPNLLFDRCELFRADGLVSGECDAQWRDCTNWWDARPLSHEFIAGQQR